MQKNVFTVTMLATDPAEEPVELTVQALLCDQVRAESELRQRRLTVEEAKITFVSAMAWAALAREGRIDVKFAEFTNRSIDVTRAKEAGDGEDVDPTQPAPSTGSA